MDGVRIAALYSYKPNKLGFCGPRSKETASLLYDFLSGDESKKDKVRQCLAKFEGAFPYYKLIASKNKIEDPFNEKVVEAYWIGNVLLENVTSSDVKRMIKHEFVGEELLSVSQAEKLIEKIPFGIKAHHSTHVFHVGSVTGRVVLKGKLLDICRICWGQAGKVKKNKIEVYYKPTIITEERKELGFYKKDFIHREPKFVPKIKKKDIISFHWQEACQVLSEEQKENLEKYTKHTLSLLK